jgi:hypothetical protein
MGYLADEIENAALNLNITVVNIDKKKNNEIRNKLAYSFSQQPDFPEKFSHQNLKNIQSFCDPKGWMLIQDYVKNNKVILFVNPDEEESMWLIPSGNALTLILSETIGFPFYVTSFEADYLLCFDDHDCLIATGKAVEWLVKIRENAFLSQSSSA